MSEIDIDIPLNHSEAMTSVEWHALDAVVKKYIPDARLKLTDTAVCLSLKATIPAPPPIPPPSQAEAIEPDDLYRLISEEGWHFELCHGGMYLVPPLTDKRRNMCTQWRPIRVLVPDFHKRPELNS